MQWGYGTEAWAIMSGETRRRDDSQSLSSDGVPCIWMTAGLVAYKLCDLDYDCDQCAFDAALQGATREAKAARARLPWTRWEFRDDRLYHPLHGWVLTLGKERVRYGLDVFASRLLAGVTTVVLPREGTKLLSGRPGCWVVEDAKVIPLRSPVAGIVLRRNGNVQQDPGLISTSPYDDGWLLELRCERALELEKELAPADQARERTTAQIRKLHRLHSRDREWQPAVGVTMTDGGEPIGDLRKVMGSEKYHRLIRRLLG
jgi:glycine cleavage system H protein